MEEQFKNKLKNYSVDWDKEELLDGLKAELSVEKKPVPWRRWLLPGLSSILLLCFGLNKCSETIEGHEAKTSTHQVNTQGKNGKSQREIETVETLTEEDDTPDQLKNELEKSNVFASTQRNSTSEDQESIDQSNLILRSLNGSTNQSLEQPTQVVMREVIQSDEAQNHPRDYQVEALTQEPIIEVATHHQDTSQEQEKTPNKAIDNQDAKNEIVNNDNVDKLKESLDTEVTPLIELDKSESVDIEDVTTEEEERLEVLTPDDTLSSGKFYISLQSDIGVVKRNRNFTSDDFIFVTQLEANEDTERSLSILTTQFKVGYQHASNWSVQSGLSYSVINEVFNFTETSYEINEEQKVRYFILDRPDTTFVYDTISVIRTSTRTIRHYNKHRFISIPLQVGYGFQRKQMDFNATLGMSYTFSHNFEGRTNQILQGNESQLIFDDPALQLKPKDRIGFNLGLDLEYPFLQNLSLFSQATYRRSPKLTKDYSDQVYHSFSLGAGVRLFFNY